ncbi:unnamed protein product [Rhodiola kirilowii]
MPLRLKNIPTGEVELFSTNGNEIQIMVTSTTLMMFAGRFGLAPSTNKKATVGLKLETRDSGLQTGDPSGFTLADTLACGTVGHNIGVGVVLGLKNIATI